MPMTVEKKQYVGFGSSFGNSITRHGVNENSTRIPFLFIPVRMFNSGEVRYSKTLSYYDKTSRVNKPVDKTYIRVANPVANYENQ